MREVAILGGGMAGLTAAWALSEPACRGDISVTVYQRGWRLGGKGASSRGVHGRIEEHGLHVWLGYYDNAFRLMRQVYSELDRPASDPSCAIPTFQEAFAPADQVGVQDYADGSWAHWIATFSRAAGEPGIEDRTDRGSLAVSTFLRRALNLLMDFAASLESRPLVAAGVVLSGSPEPPGPAPGVDDLDAASRLLRRMETGAMVTALEALRLVSASGVPRDSPAGRILGRLASLRDTIAARAGDSEDSRRAAELANMLSSCIQGIVADQLLTDPRGFGAIDHLDFCQWLRRNGATKQTCESALVRGLYDLVFAYEGGDVTRPRFSAGLGLFLTGKLFFEYKGSIFWRMQAGMGDIVFAPLYQALKSRGVRFKFFHRVDKLQLGKRGKRIRSVTLARQARVKHDVDYDPLTRVRELPCFPAAPRGDQLTEPVNSDVESHWSNRDGEEPVELRAGIDFDDIVLAVSVGMIPYICSELIAVSRRWRAMVDNVATVPTQSLQLWLRRSEAELGWPYEGATVSGYVAPFDTYASMSHLIAQEDWPADESPRSIAYFCGALSDRQAVEPAAAHALVRQNAVEFLRQRVGHFWPAAITADGDFRWDLLCGGGAARGDGRLESQHWQANTDPSDRYVQSLPGTAAHRLPADGSGCSNLFLAGDWVNSGLNAGCIEAAVMSGIEAANAVLGRPLMQDVLGSWYGVPAS